MRHPEAVRKPYKQGSDQGSGGSLALSFELKVSLDMLDIPRFIEALAPQLGVESSRLKFRDAVKGNH